MLSRTLIATTFASLISVLSVSSSYAASRSTQLVVQALEARDCSAAVRELNSALSSATPDALALGGVMFEQGLCLKKNLERAARLYNKALDAGAPSARSRLAGLYASPASGPDKGAALWWGVQAELPLPSACRVDSSARGNPEQFVQQLNTWPVQLLDACVHVTGVLAAIDAEFVLKTQVAGRGELSIDFRPATASLEVRNSQSTVALVDNSPRIATSSNAGNLFANNSVNQSATPEQMLALRAQEDRQALVRRVEETAKDALTRFPLPAGIDANWRIQLTIEGARTN